MSQVSAATLRFRLWVAAACLFLPSLSLIPFGALWLFQNGYAIYWVIGACVFVVIAFLVQRYLFADRSIPAAASPPRPAPGDAGAESWTPAETEAWNAVLAVADGVNLADFTNWDGFTRLSQQTLEAVAKTLHPEVEDPLWRFTVPEALTLIENVSLQLRPAIAENVPLGDQLTVGQVIRLYEWRGAIDLAQKGYDVWRVVRMLNPATAATQELRERLSNQMYRWGREEVGKRIARGYVKEVGRAAIDLYGGRLRVSSETLQTAVSVPTARDRDAMSKVVAEPLRILIGGQVKAGKSSLVNGLLNEVKAASDVLPLTASFTAYELKREGVPQALLIDSPGLADLKQPLETLIGEASSSDLILWVSNAVRADREIDAHALGAIREHFAARPNRRRPPVVLVLTHIDRLRPIQDWTPPYDLSDRTNAKAASIRSAMEVAAVNLSFNTEDIVPVCLDPDRGLYNVDAIWAEIGEQMPEAQRAQLVRALRAFDRNWDWRRMRGQAVNAGRVLASVVWRTPPKS